MVLVIALIALAVAVVALVIALKRQTVKVTKETKTVIEHAPAEHPFYYDDVTKTYRLDGSLNVKGSLSCANIGKEG